MSETADVVIVGGGVIGCALAAELAGRGPKVVVIERNEPGSEASGAAAGMLNPQAECRARDAFFDLALESRALYPAFAGTLAEETGIDVGYRKTGFLEVAFAGGERGALAARFAWQRASGLPVEVLEGDAIRSGIGGRLSREVDEAVFLPEEGVVNPRLLTRALWLQAERRGARVRAGISVSRFRIENGVCRGVDTDAGQIDAAAVVDSAGAWAAFDRRLPFPVPVDPVRGQIVELRLNRQPLETIMCSDDVYLVPRPDGGVLLGSTMERVGFRKGVTAEAVERLIAAAVRLLPLLSPAQFVTAWSGLRPGTPDGLPLLGDSPVRGLHLATGHFRNGILLAPVTARVLADRLTGDISRDLSAFSVERFQETLRAV